MCLRWAALAAAAAAAAALPAALGLAGGWGAARRLVRYKEVATASDGGAPSSFLVRDDANTLRELEDRGCDPSLLREWVDEGRAFPLTPDGLLHLREEELKFSASVPSSIVPSNMEAYMEREVDGKKCLVPVAVAEVVARGGRSLAELTSEGLAFEDVPSLLQHEQAVHAAHATADELRRSDLSSGLWARWNNVTAANNQSSLLNAFSDYFSHHSAGDIGGLDFTPRPGYVGTMPPGDTFEESDPTRSLPGRILHPWPAMQEVPFSTRLPVVQPFVPPATLWLALNNMYCDDYAEGLLNTSAPYIIAGADLRPGDALRIAKGGARGRSYEDSEQLEHGGMVYDSWKLPHYQGDLPATSTDPEPPLTDELRALLLPSMPEVSGEEGATDGHAAHAHAHGVDSVLLVEEERMRTARLQQLLSSSATVTSAASEQQRRGETQVRARIDAFTAAARQAVPAELHADGTPYMVRMSVNHVDDPDRHEYEVIDAEAIVRRRVKRMEKRVRRDVNLQLSVDRSAAGQHRTQAEVIDYLVESVRRVEDELTTVERTSALKRYGISAARRNNRGRRKAMAAPAEGATSPLMDQFNEMA